MGTPGLIGAAVIGGTPQDTGSRVASPGPSSHHASSNPPSDPHANLDPNSNPSMNNTPHAISTNPHATYAMDRELSRSPRPLSPEAQPPSITGGRMQSRTSSYSTQSQTQSQGGYAASQQGYSASQSQSASRSASPRTTSPSNIPSSSLLSHNPSSKYSMGSASEGLQQALLYGDRDSHREDDRASVDSRGGFSVMTSPFSVEDGVGRRAVVSPGPGMRDSTGSQGTFHAVSTVGGAGAAMQQQRQQAVSPQPQQRQQPPAGSSHGHGLEDMDGVLYYMQQMDDSKPAPPPVPQYDDESENDSEDEYAPPPPRLVKQPHAQTIKALPSTSSASNSTSPNTTGSSRPGHALSPDTSLEQHSSTGHQSKAGVGRKPSGARAARSPNNLGVNHHGDAAHPRHLEGYPEDEDEDEYKATPTTRQDTMYSDDATGRVMKDRMDSVAADDDGDQLDALAALQYLAVDDDEPTPVTQHVAKGRQQPPQNTRSGSQSDSTSSPVSPRAPQPGSPAAAFQTPAAQAQPIRSSFAPSKQAEQRKAKVQAQQAASQAAAQRPGKAAGGKKKMRVADKGAWAESSEEEEDDEDEDDDDDDDDEEKEEDGVKSKQSSQPGSGYASGGDGRQPRTLPQIPDGSGRPNGEHDARRSMPMQDGYSEQQQQQYQQQQYQQQQYQQQQQQGRQTYFDGTPIRSQAEYATTPGAARQNMWSQVLEQPVTPNAPDNGKFVQLEPESVTMTKAFTPHGLLSVGLQDKQDRSAKKQEELARESGASLINVPNKPPPPQTGLLGAVTAHERDRKREGGLGAILTEREREKRVAEERQRKFDEQQRGQMDQMQSMYGGGGYPMSMMGMNPMMGMGPMMGGMNPMMTGGPMSPMMSGGGMPGQNGMSPMMTGSGMMNPMMTGYGGMGMGYGNPQHMYAAQQAAMQAYQQAMVAFSTAGSQVGGDQTGNSNQGAPNQQQQQQLQQQQPGQMGMGMGGQMMGFDPRMSMMGMGMGGQIMNPMGMQMTGMSGFDPRFPPQQQQQQQGYPMGSEGSLVPPAPIGGGGGSSDGGSPARRGSPAQHSPLSQGHIS